MKHSNIYEKCHSKYDGCYIENYIITGEGLETFCEITYINHEGIIHPSVIIKRYEA